MYADADHIRYCVVEIRSALGFIFITALVLLHSFCFAHSANRPRHFPIVIILCSPFGPTGTANRAEGEFGCGGHKPPGRIVMAETAKCYQCSVCQKLFTMTCNLTRHMHTV